jgi:hypothetical protein
MKQRSQVDNGEKYPLDGPKPCRMTDHNAFSHRGHMRARITDSKGTASRCDMCDMSGRACVSAALPVADWRPAQSGQHCGDSALLGCSNFGGLEHKDVPGDVRHANARERHNVRANRFLPRVAFEAIVLLWFDMLPLEFLVCHHQPRTRRCPRDPSGQAEQDHRLRTEHVRKHCKSACSPYHEKTARQEPYGCGDQGNRPPCMFQMYDPKRMLVRSAVFDAIRVSMVCRTVDVSTFRIDAGCSRLQLHHHWRA